MNLNPLSKLPETPLSIQRALISVSDKSGIDKLAATLHRAGVEILSTGGTAEHIRNHDIPVTDISDVTGFPECLDGRVKTLHPAIHAGILARTSHLPDREELDELEVEPIDLVVINLYPFQEVASKKDVTIEEATETIDIGGPTMVRAAAKNFAHVCVLTHPGQYGPFKEEFEEDHTITFETRKQLARDAFNHTAAYENHIAGYFNRQFDESNPPQLNISLPRSQELRYGENPHQHAAAYGRQDSFIDCFHGKKLSYNNLLDVDAALRLIADFEEDEPTCAIFKHTVPCGVATATSLREAWNRAFSTDTISPFGGIVAVNRDLDHDTAETIDEIFTEIIIAPSFSEEAVDLLTQNRKRRLVRIRRSVREDGSRSYRSIFGGALSQESDFLPERFNEYETVTERKPDENEQRNLRFAWKVVKHVKSNGIVFARDGQTVGIGTGQTSRVESSEIAIAGANKEELSLEGSVVASDAFFPFPDGVEAAAEAGATAVIQPGGSIRDSEVIDKADELGLAMVLTGHRHFRH